MVDKGVSFHFMAILAIISTCFAVPKWPYVLDPSTSTYSGIGNSDISICNDPLLCVTPFVSAFTNAVQSSNILLELFDMSQTTPSNYRRFLNDYIYASASNLGMPTPDVIASIASQPIEQYLDSLTSPVMIKIYANSVANILQSQGLLNPNNAISLGLSYAKALEEIARSNIVEGQVDTKLKSLLDGYEKFLRSFNLLVVGKGSILATHFANAVKLVGEELRGR